MTHRPELLAKVQWKLRRYRWEPEIRETTRTGKTVDYQPRRRLHSKAHRLAVADRLRNERLLLGPRWLNPLAWARVFHIVDNQRATELVITSKLEGNQ